MNGQEQPTHRSMPKPTWAGICRLLYSLLPSAGTVMFPSVHIWLLGLSLILGGEIGLLWVSYHLLLNRWNSEEDTLRHGYSVKHWRRKCGAGRNTWGSPVQTCGQQEPGFRCLYQQPTEVMRMSHVGDTTLDRLQADPLGDLHPALPPQDETG